VKTNLSKNTFEEINIIKSLFDFNKHNINSIIIDTNNYCLKPPNKLSKKINFFQITDKYKRNSNATLLNQNIFDFYNKSSDHNLSSRFALINNKVEQHNFKKNNIKKICISFGTVDSKSLTYKLIKFIFLNKDFNKYEFFIILGQYNNDKKKIRSILNKKNNFKIYDNINDLSRIYKNMDLAIGNCGLSNLERLHFGIPSILISSNFLQKKISQDLDSKKICKYFGHYNIKFDGNLKKKFITLFNAKHELFKLKINSYLSIDNFGALRFIYKNILSLNHKEIILRNSKYKDIFIYYRWANEPMALKQSIINRTILFNEHLKWFKSRLKKKFMYILYHNKLPLGQIRLDKIHHSRYEYLLDYSVDLDFRGKGLGKTLIILATKKMLLEIKTFTILAYVKIQNSSSRSVFINLGYSEYPTKKNNLTLFKKTYEKN
tara:strand:+ start:8542 stop:9840 length:1299 start_codon:yes stop_codon:yes gene_type:complete